MRSALSFSVLFALVGACSGSDRPQLAKPGGGGAADQGSASQAAATYGPLEVGADYKSYTKVTTGPAESPSHGRRFVEIWVNDVGLASYQGEAEFPVGTIIVKESWERDGDKPSSVRGPLFVMEKRAAGFDEEHNDWFYAFHWADVPAPWADKLGAKQVYWRSPSKKVAYCWECHENYDREVGLPAKGYRVWEREAPK